MTLKHVYSTNDMLFISFWEEFFKRTINIVKRVQIDIYLENACIIASVFTKSYTRVINVWELQSYPKVILMPLCVSKPQNHKDRYMAYILCVYKVWLIFVAFCLTDINNTFDLFLFCTFVSGDKSRSV